MKTKQSEASGYRRPTVREIKRLEETIQTQGRIIDDAMRREGEAGSSLIRKEKEAAEKQQASALQIFTSMQALVNQLLIQSVDGKVSLEMVGWASNLLQQTDSTHRLWTHANAPSSSTPSTDA